MPTTIKPSRGQFSGLHWIADRLSLYRVTAQDIRRTEAPISSSDSDQTSTAPKARTVNANRNSSPPRITLIARDFLELRQAPAKRPRSRPCRPVYCQTSGCRDVAVEPAGSVFPCWLLPPDRWRSRDG